MPWLGDPVMGTKSTSFNMEILKKKQKKTTFLTNLHYPSLSEAMWKEYTRERDQPRVGHLSHYLSICT